MTLLPVYASQVEFEKVEVTFEIDEKEIIAWKNCPQPILAHINTISDED